MTVNFAGIKCMKKNIEDDCDTCSDELKSSITCPKGRKGDDESE